MDYSDFLKLLMDDVHAAEERESVDSAFDQSLTTSYRRSDSKSPTLMSQDSTSKTTVSTPPETEQEKASDPFLYFSNDERRLDYLLGREHSHTTLSEPIERKTRVSFELDPLFSLTQSYPELLIDDQSA